LSSHPIARAIGRLNQSKCATGLHLYPGQGAAAKVDGHRVAVGGRGLFAELGWIIPPALACDVARDLPPDAAVSYVGWDGSARGALVTRDRQRPEWEAVIRRLRRGRRLVLLTGAERPGAYADLADECHAGIPPGAKAAIVGKLRSQGRVVMIGDGSNDAPGLAEADLGIAFGAVTSLAAEAADIVIPGDRLDRLFVAFALMRHTHRRTLQNLGWALLYNATAIPLAVSGLLNPLFAALAMAGSSMLVVWNSSRPLPVSEVLGHESSPHDVEGLLDLRATHRVERQR
jgi:Cu2+-exporting ATPase